MLTRELKDKDMSLLRLSRDYQEEKSENMSLQRLSIELKHKLDTAVE